MDDDDDDDEEASEEEEENDSPRPPRGGLWYSYDAWAPDVVCVVRTTTGSARIFVLAVVAAIINTFPCSWLRLGQRANKAAAGMPE